MAAHFDALATSEGRSAETFRRLTIAMIVAGGALAAFLLFAPAVGLSALALDGGDYVHLVQRFIVTASVLGLAGYFARQSAQHRSISDWAHALAVQLTTFDAFTDPIASREVKEALRTTFAQRVFGEPPSPKSDASNIGTSSLAEKFLELVARDGKS